MASNPPVISVKRRRLLTMASSRQDEATFGSVEILLAESRDADRDAISGFALGRIISPRDISESKARPLPGFLGS